MKQYKQYSKAALMGIVRQRMGADAVKPAIAPKVNFWDISQWPKRWEEGAKILEQSSPGKLITAPIRLPEAIITATTKTAQEVPGVVKTTASAIPILAVTLGILGAGYLVYKFKKDKKEKVDYQNLI